MRTSAGTSPSLVGPTSGCSSSPSQFSSAHFIRYSWARCTGLRVWKPTTVVQPCSAKAAPVRALLSPLDGPVGRYALTPAETRAAFAEHGWTTVVGGGE